MFTTQTFLYSLPVVVSLVLLSINWPVFKTRKQRRLACEGAALFASDDYFGAFRRYCEAIQEPGGRKNATEVDRTLAQAWYFRGVNEDCLGYYKESIQFYQQAVSFASTSRLRKQYRRALESAKDMNAHSKSRM
ncbi:hypothetical protein B0H17DRAFT_1132551 [Mycena rosella]|uniref:Uncharacterized protein n=1 Tax=Mycena rosella TaxID=1033263 RepID=A0AAD7DKH9_MYCRO|nr:hypothetical protein B0H17DRAFT_1132551 [Mycena rosella]